MNYIEERTLRLRAEADAERLRAELDEMRAERDAARLELAAARTTIAKLRTKERQADMKTIYGIESKSGLTGKRRLNVTLYTDYDQTLFVARRIDPALEAEIVEFHLDETPTKMTQEQRNLRALMRSVE